MENTNEGEEEVVVTPEAEEETQETEGETTDWKAKYEETQGRLKRMETKLSKASETKTEKAPSKLDGFDYGQKAFLTTQGIKGAKEFEFVQSELKKSGEDLDTLIENDYFKAKLEKFRALGKTAEATPTGKRSSGVATESVEYWATKPLEEVPKDMRTKVVNHLIDKEKNKGQFYNS